MLFVLAVRCFHYAKRKPKKATEGARKLALRGIHSIIVIIYYKNLIKSNHLSGCFSKIKGDVLLIYSQ